MFDVGVTAVVMDAAEQSFFTGCADGSIYQVELFKRVSTSVLLLKTLFLLGVFKRDLFLAALRLFSYISQKMSRCGKSISGTLE